MALREDVQSIRKVAGRNVTVSEHRGKGTVINARRDRAGSCCERDIDEISTIDITLSIDAVFHGVCGTGSRSESFTWNFVRISKDDTFDCLTKQFKFYLGPPVDGCCSLNFADTQTYCSNGVYPHDWGKAGNICEDGDFRFPIFNCTFDDDCNTGTLDLRGDNVIGIVEARYGGSDGCADAPCSFIPCDTGFADLATGIEITTCDFTNLIGTYTLSNTCSAADYDVTVTVEMVVA